MDWPVKPFWFARGHHWTASHNIMLSFFLFFSCINSHIIYINPSGYKVDWQKHYTGNGGQFTSYSNLSLQKHLGVGVTHYFPGCSVFWIKRWQIIKQKFTIMLPKLDRIENSNSYHSKSYIDSPMMTCPRFWSSLSMASAAESYEVFLSALASPSHSTTPKDGMFKMIFDT